MERCRQRQAWILNGRHNWNHLPIPGSEAIAIHVENRAGAAEKLVADDRCANSSALLAFGQQRADKSISSTRLQIETKDGAPVGLKALSNSYAY